MSVIARRARPIEDAGAVFQILCLLIDEIFVIGVIFLAFLIEGNEFLFYWVIASTRGAHAVETANKAMKNLGLVLRRLIGWYPADVADNHPMVRSEISWIYHILKIRLNDLRLCISIQY